MMAIAPSLVRPPGLVGQGGDSLYVGTSAERV
jgi:hypothetical protein